MLKSASGNIADLLTRKKLNLIVVAGPTASGKTHFAVQLCDKMDGEIISADSRQVYIGLDIGSGKDLSEYNLSPERQIPHHLIDIVPPTTEYSVFDFQQDFFEAFGKIRERGNVPLLCGGTGLYIDCILRNYKLQKVPTNMELRQSLNGKPTEELIQLLQSYPRALHNSTDTTERHRLLRAIEIADFTLKNPHCEPDSPSYENVAAFVFYITAERPVLREKIHSRLHSRLNEGMIEEVENLLKKGVSAARLEQLGLEYRFVSRYLQGKITKTAMEEELFRAICQFAKRQETWFRGMERKGVFLHRISPETSPETCIKMIDEFSQ